MKTDTSERGLETLIMRHLTGVDGRVAGVAEPGGNGWFAGSPAAYDREFAVDADHLFAFLRITPPEGFSKLELGDYRDTGGIARRKFLARLQGEAGHAPRRREAARPARRNRSEAGS